tara:strand:+ start:40 stop:327 length:288 start_codon:yes stop_codon:yes gene_type:complete
MAKLKKIRIFSLAKLQGILFSYVGLLCGIFYSFGGFIYDLATTGSLNLGTALAFFALIGMPLIFASFGFIVGIILAVLYNLFSRLFGGANIDLAH